MSKAATPRRSASRRPSLKTLAPLGAERLAELLVGAAKSDAALMRSLALEVAGPELAGEIDRQIMRIRKATSWLDARKATALSREIIGLAQAITQRLGPRDPAAAVERLLALLELGPGLLERQGSSGETFRTLLVDLGPVVGELLAVVPNAVRSDLAAAAYRIHLADGYGLTPDLMVQVAEAIGPAARQTLRSQVLADLASQRRTDGDPRGGPLYPVFKLADTLGVIADAEGDVDAFAAAQALKGPRARDDLAIARRLLDAARSAEALAVVVASVPSASRPADALSALKIQALDALQRGEEAQALRWTLFETRLSSDALRAYLNRLPDFKDVEAEARALAYVEAHPDALVGLAFLAAWPDLHAAARLVRARWRELDGEVYERLTPAAEALGLKHPLAATLLYRRMIDDALQFGRSGRYRHAARHLQDCASLASAIIHWETHPPHSSYLEGLVQRHRYKESFWDRLAGA